MTAQPKGLPELDGHGGNKVFEDQPLENYAALKERCASFGWDLQAMTPSIGAEVLGIDLTKEMSADELKTLREVLLDWKVMFFRDQDITSEDHVRFSGQFGELEVHPFAPCHPDHRELLVITHDENSKGRENAWHSDVTWREAPSLGSVLRARELPEVGGDTLFSNMYAAYDGLSDEIKEKIEGRKARHDFWPFRMAMQANGAPEEQIKAFEEKYPNPWHPIVRTHPETGRKGIYVNVAFTLEVEGMDDAEGRELLKHLWAQAATPEYQCRFRWAPNSIAFWDNRSCQHYAASDYFPNRRVMERATIIGDVPR